MRSKDKRGPSPAARAPLLDDVIGVSEGYVSFALSDEKGVGANHRAQVMLQAGIQPSLVLAQAQLLLGFLVHSLGTSALFEHVY